MTTPALGPVIQHIIDDDSISDDVLHQRAAEYLKILDDRHIARRTTPKWLRGVCRLALVPRPGFKPKRMFSAMYHTADELGLTSGKRYVSAAICACVSEDLGEKLRTQPLDPEDKELHRLAKRFGALACAWLTQMLWPFYPEKAASIYGPQNTNAYWRYPRGGSLEDDVMRRHGYMCILTESVLSTIERPYRPSEFNLVSIMGVAHIISLSVVSKDASSKIQSKADTFEILRRFCGVDKDMIENVAEMVDQPYNRLCMERNTQQNFEQMRWCLKATGTPNCYRPEMFGQDWGKGPPSVVNFEDHSAKWVRRPEFVRTPQRSKDMGDGLEAPAVDPPSPKLLQMHAAVAMVMNVSGAMDGRPLRLHNVASSFQTFGCTSHVNVRPVYI